MFSIKYFFDIDQEILKKANLVITGTCLDQSIDKYWTLYTKEHNIVCVSIIECQSLYSRRLVLKEHLIYPDYIFVNDEMAKKSHWKIVFCLIILLKLVVLFWKISSLLI